MRKGRKRAGIQRWCNLRIIIPNGTSIFFYPRTIRMKRQTRRSKRMRRNRRTRRNRRQRGGSPTMISCGSGKCSTTGQTVVTYKGMDPVDSVPSFVSAEEANKMHENDQY